MGLWIAFLFFVEMLQSCHFFLFLPSFKQKETSCRVTFSFQSRSSLVPVDLAAEKREDLVDCMKNKYGEGNVSEEICPKCCKKFKCLSAGIYENESGMMQYYADDYYACDVCSKEEEWYSY